VIDAVLSYHLNRDTCGVARFNIELAKRIGVPCVQIDSDEGHAAKAPLLSVKWAEMPLPLPPSEFPWSAFDVLSHDHPDSSRAQEVLAAARRIWYADEIGCPSTITGNPSRGSYRVLVFGMAHKLVLPHFEALKQDLEITHPDYTVELSTAVHEGSPWDQALADSVTAMRGIFGDKLRVLGYLGDDALAKELREVDAVACFFVPALRANNTTYWAAVEAGKRIYTNRDEFSPKDGDPPATWERLLELIA
jgi:hypothetical protein